MSFHITVQPSGHQFECEADETVLAAAIRAGVGLPYGCKNGACGSCKGKLVSGEVSHKPYQERALTAEEVAAGWSLFCCATPHADLQIEVREVAGSGDYPLKKMPSRVASIEKVAPDVVIITLQLPATEKLQYRAGQYIEFMLRDGKRRSYSIANAPDSDAPLSLHIRHMPGGLFTDQVFGTLKERDILRFEGPLGTFFIRDDSDKPVVLLASGTGFAPIKAIVEHLIASKSARPIMLPVGRRTAAAALRAGGVRGQAGRPVERPRRLCAPGRHGRPARPVRLPGVCLRRPADDRVGQTRFRGPVPVAGRRVLRRRLHQRRRPVLRDRVGPPGPSLPAAGARAGGH